MRIGEVAAAVGLTVKALRFYEKQGLLPRAERCANGYRKYPPETIGRLDFIRRGKEAGLGLAGIREIIQVRDSGQMSCAQVIDQLGRRLTDLDRQIADLTALRKSVAELHRAAVDADSDQCDPRRICSHL